jgi:tetratricopeptide (TPR) repeat protein
VDQELAGALATHYLAAYRNAAEGPEADALAAQARIALRGAGDRAVVLGAQEQALGFFRDALEVTSEPVDRAALLERAGTAASAAAFHEEAERLLEGAIELLRAAGDRSGAARVSGSLADAMFGRYRLDAALALVGAAAGEFADLGEDPGYASLLGQLSRFQMLRQVDFAAAVATADRALAIAERLDRVDLVADVLVTRGTALTSMGRAYEGIGCLETGLRLAERHGLLGTEIRARTNLGGPLTDRDPRAAFEVSRVGLELARRFGDRQAVSMLVVNASTGAIESGEWDFARAAIRAGLDEAASDEERITLLSFLVQVLVEGGVNADVEIDEVERWLAAHVEVESSLAPLASGMRAARSLQRGDLAAAASGLLEGGRLDPYNAVASFSETTLLALLARDRGRARAGVDALRATGSHAAIALLMARAGEAGIAALDGGADTARAGLLAAYGDLREVGAARKQALTGLALAALLGSGDPQVRVAIDESRQLLESMGAGLWLGLLDDAEAAGAAMTKAHTAAPQRTMPSNPAVPADRA